MNKVNQNTVIPNTNKPVVDCAGNLIQTSKDGFYNQRCFYGNLEDYQREHQNYIIPDISYPQQIPLKPSLINIIVPIYNSGASILPTVRSLLNLKFNEGINVELCFLVNGPQNITKEASHNNTTTLQLLETIFTDSALMELQYETEVQQLQDLYQQRQNAYQILIVQTTTIQGLGEVYQKGVSSYLQRLWNYAQYLIFKNVSKTKVTEQINLLEKISTILFFDDDITVTSQSIQQSYDACIHQNCIGVGRVNISHIISPNMELAECLKIIMQCWLEFKEAYNMNTLPPRMATLDALHHSEDVPLNEDYADQKLFAKLRASGKKSYRIEYNTVIKERDFPSNGGFMKQLRLYLDNEKNVFQDLEFLRNIVLIYDQRGDNHYYTKHEVNSFIDLIQSRKLAEIITSGKILLQKRDIYK